MNVKQESLTPLMLDRQPIDITLSPLSPSDEQNTLHSSTIPVSLKKPRQLFPEKVTFSPFTKETTASPTKGSPIKSGSAGLSWLEEAVHSTYIAPPTSVRLASLKSSPIRTSPTKSNHVPSVMSDLQLFTGKPAHASTHPGLVKHLTSRQYWQRVTRPPHIGRYSEGNRFISNDEL